MNIAFSIGRIWAIFLHVLYGTRRNFGKLMEFTYWPLVDIFLFGFLGLSFTQTHDSSALIALMSGLLLWQVTHRTSLEISRNILQEMWDNNLINIITTPLSITEWIIGLMLTGLLGISFTIPFGIISIKLLYGINILHVGLPLAICIALLAMSGWILGIIGSCFLMRWGQKIDSIVWAMIWLPTPFCGVYYAVEVLPQWAQYISVCLPMTYAFKALRTSIATGILPMHEIALSFGINVLYLGITLLLFNYIFRVRKSIGLTSI